MTTMYDTMMTYEPRIELWRHHVDKILQKFLHSTMKKLMIQIECVLKENKLIVGMTCCVFGCNNTSGRKAEVKLYINFRSLNKNLINAVKRKKDVRGLL